MDQSVEASWLSHRFFLPEDQRNGPEPAWLESYKNGLKYFFKEEPVKAKECFLAAARTEGCPATIYTWLISICPYVKSNEREENHEEENQYREQLERLPTKNLEGWANSTAEEKNALGYCYLRGIGTDKNVEKSTSFFREAAQQGYAVAQINMGNYYSDKQNFTKAAEYFQLAAAQGLPIAKQLLSLVQKNIHLQRTREAGSWLLYPIGLLSMLLAIGFGGMAVHLNPLWFAEFGHIFGGIFLTAGLVGAVGVVVWAIGSLLALPAYIRHIIVDFAIKKLEAESSDPTQNYNFLNYISENLSFWSFVKVGLFAIPLIIMLIVMQETNLFALLSQTLLAGLTTLAGVPGLDFLSPFLTSTFTDVAAQMFCILSPFIVYAAINRVITTFRSDDHEERKLIQEDKERTPRKGEEVTSTPNPHKDILHKDASAHAQDQQTINFDESSGKQKTPQHTYTPEQEEYCKKNPGQYLVRALYDFTPERNDTFQLTLKEGDLIWVVDSHPEEDWWIGVNDNTKEKGYFPANYIEVLDRESQVTKKPK